MNDSDFNVLGFDRSPAFDETVASIGQYTLTSVPQRISAANPNRTKVIVRSNTVGMGYFLGFDHTVSTTTGFFVPYRFIFIDIFPPGEISATSREWWAVSADGSPYVIIVRSVEVNRLPGDYTTVKFERV